MTELRSGLKYILDTNVLLGAMKADLAPYHAEPKDHICARVLDAVQHSHGRLYLSNSTAAELYRIGVDHADRTGILAPLETGERIHYIDKLLNKALRGHAGFCFVPCRDPDDQMFLHLAYGVGADYIISRDGAVLDMDGQINARCIHPTQFLSAHGFLRRHQPEPLPEPPPIQNTILPYFSKLAKRPCDRREAGQIMRGRMNCHSHS